MDLFKRIQDLSNLYDDDGPSATVPESRPMFNDGGRIGFMEGKLVEQGPNTGKIAVKDLKLIKDKEGNIISRQTKYFKDMDAANAAIQKHKEGKSGQLKYKKSKKILNDPKLKSEFLKYSMGKDVTGKMIRKKYGLSNDEFFYGGLREIIDKDFLQYSKSQVLKSKTIKNMLLLHNNKLSKDFIRNGLIVPDDIIEKLGLNTSEAATASARLSQHYSGMDFGFKELKSIRRNSKSGNKLFEAMNKFSFGNPYRSKLYNISLQLIDDQLGNETGTFESLKKKASYILKKNKIKGFDINEIAGVTGTAKTGVGEFSQFIDVMDSNLNQKQMASFQAAFSVARQNILDNPNNFTTESKKINKLASRFEKEYGVKLPRIRDVGDVEKYYSPKRLEELKNQGLDIKAASKKLGYTVQMPPGAMTINEFVDQSTPNAKTVMKKLMVFCPAGTATVTKAGGGRVPYADGPVCTPDEAIRGMNEEFDKIKKGNATAGEASRTVNKFKNLGVKGMSGLLKAGLVSEVAYEAALGFDKVISEGQSPMQAFRQSYLTAPLRAIGAMKSFEEGEREEILDAARDKGKVGRVLDLQNLVGDKNKLASNIQGLKSNVEDLQRLDDGDFGYMGGTQGQEDALASAQANLQDMYRSGELSKAEQLFSTKPQDLKLKDKTLMDAYNDAIEKRRNIQAERSSIAQSIAADKNRVRDANKAMLEKFPIYTPEIIDSMYERAKVEKPKNLDYADFGKQMSDYDKMNYFADNFRTEKAGGGIAGLSGGDPKGAMTTSMNPDSQGLSYLFNRVKKV